MESKIDNFVLIIGAMKCGTSSLFAYLSQHPQIAVPQKKEIHFFSDIKNFSKGYRYYQSCWEWNSNIHKYALEATPAYTRVTHPKKLNAAHNIAKMQLETDANFKFIYIMRNPIDRIESHYNHALLWTNKEVIKSPNANEIDSEALDTSKYAMQISEYYQRFSSSNIMLLNFEDLKHNPQQLLKKLCTFLNIETDYNFQNLEKVHNMRGETKMIAIPGWYKINRIIPLDFIRQKVPTSFKKPLRQYLVDTAKVKKNIKLTDKQKQYAKQKLYSDLVELSSKYKVDIRSWNIEI